MSSEVEIIVNGLCLIGDVLSPIQNPDTFQTITLVAMGNYLDEIKAAIRYREELKNGSEPVSEEIINFTYLYVLETARHKLRVTTAAASKHHEQEEHIRLHTERIKRMRSLSAQHPAGTTAEIAELLKTTKAGVRRMKADGTLNAIIELARSEEANANQPE